MNIDELKQLLATFDAVDLHGPVDESVIERSELHLGFVLPPQYRVFVREFGCGGVGSEEFIGLGGPPHLDLVTLTERLRQRSRLIPENYYPLRADGFGNYDCLDVTHPTHDGEFAVVEWRHDVEQASPSRVLAHSYFEWFEQILGFIEKDDAIEGQ
ncbi:MAG: SMI1/KNR4 family protein [Xanthomonadales bacterium]|nr:SMI1/KNR4 family protein [Xanthomonadales bacterium]